MSRFFAGGSSDSDTSSSEEDFSDSEQSAQNDSDSENGSDSEDSGTDSDSDDSDAPKAKGAKFMAGADSEDSDDESDDGKRIVKSAKDKRQEEIDASVHIIENAQKINDWVTISNEFDKLNKLAEKAKAAHNLPKIYISTIVEIENESVQAIKAAKTKKFSPANTRALNAIKQRIKKNKRLYEDEIARFLADPDYEEEVLKVEQTAPRVKEPKTLKADRLAATSTTPEDEDDGFATVGKGGKVLEYSTESIFKHLQAVFEARGKKNTNREEQLNVLARLKEVSQTPYQKLRVLLATIAARFDFQANLSQFMPVEAWKRAQEDITELLTLLEAEREYTILEDAPEHDDEQAQPLPSDETPIVQIKGSLISYVDRLDDELTRALQNIDPHSQDYIDRLRDESALYTTIVRAQIYVESNGEKDIARLIMRRLDHLYYKSLQLVAAIEIQTYEKLPAGLESKITPRNDDVPLIKRLSTYLHKNGNGLQRTRAMLCNIYNMALADQFYQARDMLLMSHLQDTINNADIQTQILHNRTMVQLGLSAFRNGLIVEAQQALSEICGGNRAKELLAQGLSKNRDVEQERQDKARQLPFHLHLNIELSECVYLTSSMLMEIPEMARGSKRVISRQFRRTLDFSDRQIFSGPPENTRDYIMQSARALANGDWEKSFESLAAIKILDLMPNVDSIKTMLKLKVKEEGLRTYLFTYAPYYQSVALSQLSSLFDLTTNETLSIVSKMIASEEITATLSSDDASVIFRRSETTRLQTQAMQLAEKAQRLVEANEQALDLKSPQNQRDGQRDGDNRARRNNNQNYGGGRGGRRLDFQTRLSQKIRA